MSYKEVPTTEAKRICTEYEKSQVAILSWDPAYRVVHTTTYGVTAFDKEQAAVLGRLIAKTAGCDLNKKVEFEDFHNDYHPALYKEALELLRKIQEQQENHPTLISSVRSIQDFLKRAAASESVEI